ncbi:hypothetical protein [Variovorax sp. UC122_21]|uniref:hypothetical protein n=1 Tax=Variovorax sp. UC122_21 TaxID=3374554 RepID=UPI00375674F1
MTTANPPAAAARILFFSRPAQPQPAPRPTPRLRATGRLSTWPFRVLRHNEQDDPHDIKAQAARVLRTTAQQWWPKED